MNVLDDIGAMKTLDPGGMLGHLEGFPGQMREAVRIGREAELTTSGEAISSVVVLGMGGSAIGGELAGAYLFDEIDVPFEIVRGYSVPAYVGPGSLAVVSSYSGNTEETLAAYREAASRRASIVCFSTGGEVGEIAAQAGHDLVRIPEGLPPRAALAYSLLPLLIVLSRLGLVRERWEEMEEAVGVAEQSVALYGAESHASSNPAKDLAAWLRGSIPVVYGAPPWTRVVANRWIGQFSENAKVVAHRNDLPEMNHNEIVGWSGELPLAAAAKVVFLRDEGDHPRIARRIELTREEISRTGTETREAESTGSSRLGRLISLISIGDFASFYLAMLGGVDPTPVKPIDRLKAALSDA